MVVGIVVIDVVNVGQLQVLEQGVLCYDFNVDGSVNYVSVMLGQIGMVIMLCNFGLGQVSVISGEVINGVQLFVVNQVVVIYLGGGVVVDVNGVLIVLIYLINNVVVNGIVIKGDYNDVGIVFDVVSNLLVNVVDQIGEIDKLVVKYDVDGSGNVFNSVMLMGIGSGVVKIINVVVGSILVGSSDVIIGDQLFSIYSIIVNYFGGIIVYNGIINVWIVLMFSIFSIVIDGMFISGDYNNVMVVFIVVDGLLKVFNQCIINGGGGSVYLVVNLMVVVVIVVGVEVVVVGLQVSVVGVNSVVVGNGVSSSVGNSVVLGVGLVVSVGVQSGYIGVYGQIGVSNLVGEILVGSIGSECKIIYVVDGLDIYDVINVGQLKNGVNYVIDELKKYIDQKIQNIINVVGSFCVNNINNLVDLFVSGVNLVVGGVGFIVVGVNLIVLGNGLQVQVDNLVVLGVGLVVNWVNMVLVGVSGVECQVVNVVDGLQVIDVVNVCQLQVLQQGIICYDIMVNGVINYNSVMLGFISSGLIMVCNVVVGIVGIDVVNVDQLKLGMVQILDWFKVYIDECMGGFECDLCKIDNCVLVGIVLVMVIVVLLQFSEVGCSMVLIVVGSYNGELGVVFGIFGVFEGGCWIYKFSGLINSCGEVGVVVGVGIQW